MKLTPWITLALMFCVPFASGQEQEEPFREEVDVSLVLVDAVVVDDDGNQILGLGPDDFIITEDGVEQEIESVEYFSNRRSLDDPELDETLRLHRDETNRYFVLFFDKSGGSIDNSRLRNQFLRAARDAEKFVRNEIVDGDFVAIAGFDARLEIYSDFTSDEDRLEEALHDAIRFGTGVTTPPDEGPSILANLDHDEMVNKTGRIYDALRLVGDALGELPGRKVLVLFTPGFGSGPTGHEDDIWFDPMIESLNQSNTSVYVMNMMHDAPFSPLENTTARLADDTGGYYYRRPINYSGPLRDVENINNGYYLISYEPSHPPGEHGYQEIEVSLRSPEFRITARDGYRY